MCSLVWTGAQAIRESLVMSIIIIAMVVAAPAAVCAVGKSNGRITTVHASGVKSPDSTGLCGVALDYGQKKFHAL
jgi:hypothetical protein